MSEHEHGYSHPPAEEDVLPAGKIYVVGVVALVVFLAGSIAAGVGMRAVRRQVNPDGPARTPVEAGRAKIGMVEQRLFEHANMGPVWREAAHQRLSTFGWVDRQKGIVHIPIDRAMELVEKGARP
jgi:hypothetical protein